MPAVAKYKALKVTFAQAEGLHSVTRNTLRDLRGALGLPSESAVIHYALAALRDAVLPGNPPDNGPVPGAMLRHIRATVSQETRGGQSLFDTE